MTNMVRQGDRVEKTREGAIRFFKRVLEENHIKPFYQPDAPDIPEDWDDLNK